MLALNKFSGGAICDVPPGLSRNNQGFLATVTILPRLLDLL